MFEFGADKAAIESNAGDEGCATAEERVEDGVAGIGGGEDAAFDEGDGFLGGVFAVTFFSVAGRGHAPYGFHLFAAVDLAHGLVVEVVFAFLAFGSPDDGFGAVGEVAATEVGRWIGFFPGDV